MRQSENEKGLRYAGERTTACTSALRRVTIGSWQLNKRYAHRLFGSSIYEAEYAFTSERPTQSTASVLIDTLKGRGWADLPELSIW
jgi:hypothetical protein